MSTRVKSDFSVRRESALADILPKPLGDTNSPGQLQASLKGGIIPIASGHRHGIPVPFYRQHEKAEGVATPV